MILVDAATLQLRAALYRALAAPFRFPDPRETARFRSGAWQAEIATLCESLCPLQVVAPTVLRLEDDACETAFIALFEVGLGGAPCPLHSGHYGRERMITLEEVVRFYRFFDFTPTASGDHMPDHISAELDFMAHLAEFQRRELERGGDALSPLRAQRDFIERHLAAWLPELERRVLAASDEPFFREMVKAANDFVVWDHDLLNTTTAQEAQEIGVRHHG